MNTVIARRPGADEAIYRPTRRQRQILALLSDGRRRRESEIKSSFDCLQHMWALGWLDGAGRPDAGGVGTTKETRLWWITPRGAAALAEAAP